GAIAARMVQIIDFMASLQMNTATFLHYLSWNLEIPGCMVHEQYARTVLMRCKQLPGILKHWHKPPSLHDKGVSTRGARDAMNEWSFENVAACLNSKMRNFSPHLESPPDHMSEELLLGISLKDNIAKM
ncbi:hypothetical protein BC835DRAFT_1224843, partial [Cytidiella melzeri]